MKVWSKGLGKIELILDFSEYTVRREGEDILIEGVITDPVYWDFRITMSGADVPGLLHVALNRTMIGMFLVNVSKVFGFFAGAAARIFRGNRRGESREQADGEKREIENG